jgi:rare lipoprotein A
MRRELRMRSLRFAGLAMLATGCLALAGCGAANKSTSRVDPKYGVSPSPRVVQPGQPVPKGGGTYRVGRPYVVGGRTYTPRENRRYRAEGIASWYGSDFHGRLTANGEVYDMEAISAAHPTLPIPSYARVTNLQNGRSVVVRVNDRGPFHANRIIDLSQKAAELLHLRRSGVGRVRVEYVGQASLDGSDDRRLLATLSVGRPAPAPVRIAAARPFVPPSPPVAQARATPARDGGYRPSPVAVERPAGMAQRAPETVHRPTAAALAPMGDARASFGRGLY